MEKLTIKLRNSLVREYQKLAHDYKTEKDATILYLKEKGGKLTLRVLPEKDGWHLVHLELDGDSVEWEMKQLQDIGDLIETLPNLVVSE